MIITQLTLADGNWCDLFKYLVDRGSHASVVVSSPQADERLWSEVLWRGAYDLLVERTKAVRCAGSSKEPCEWRTLQGRREPPVCNSAHGR